MIALVGALLGVSHPAAAQHKTWYLAEGATNDFFQEEILIANPNAGPATVNVAFLLSDRPEVNVPVTIQPGSRFTLRANEVPGLENATASAVVTSDVDILVERSMYWIGSARRGGHHSVGVAAPAPKWYLAEGSLGFFDTFILIGNPGTETANVTVTYLRASGGPLTATYTVAPRSRHTIYVNQEAPDAGDFSTIVETTNGTNVVVERAMYWNGFEGGHNATGITTPALTWGFAEGFTADNFNTFLLLGNPNASEATARITYLFDDGSAPFQQDVSIGAQARLTIEANAIPQLQNRAFATLVESTNGQPIVAERAMYFAGFQDGHVTAGLTTLAPKWGFAEGLEDRLGNLPYETFYLFTNATESDTVVNITFYREDGTGVVGTLAVPRQSRGTLSGKSFPALSNQRFAAFVETSNGVSIAAERVVYWGDGRFGGSGSTGTPWTGTIAAPLGAPAGATISGVAASSGVAGNAVAVIGTNFHRDTRVSFGGTAAPAVFVESATRLVATVPSRSGTGAVDVAITGPTGDAMLPSGFTYEAGAPPPPPAFRAPDPPAGQLLPLPNMAGLVAEVAAQYPGALRNSCQEHGGSWEFLDRVVERLRQADTRWGYNCKRGNCPDISQDVVAYHAGAGPETNGALQTYTVDVVSGHCGGNPVWWWGPHAYGTGPDAARWHDRFRGFSQ